MGADSFKSTSSRSRARARRDITVPSGTCTTVGDLLVRQPFHLAQHEHFPVVGRQLLHRRADAFHGVLLEEPLFRVEGVVGSHITCGVQRRLHSDPPTRHAAVPRVAHDRQQPWPGIVITQRREEAHGTDAGVLDYVLCLGLVPGEPPRIVEGCVQVGQDRLLECTRGHQLSKDPSRRCFIPRNRLPARPVFQCRWHL